jgi:FtsX-like permease family protein
MTAEPTTAEREKAPAGRRAQGRRSRGSPLWTKAPLALVRYPGLLAAVVVGALLLSLVAAAFPLFLSRSEGDLLRARITDPTVGRNGAGLFYSITNVGFREKARGGQELLADRLDEAFGRIAAEGPNLGPPLRFVLGADALVTLPGEGEPESGPVSGRIFSGTDAEEYVDVLAGDGSNGALVPDSVADFVGVGPGDEIQLNGGSVLRVGGVYRALYKTPRSPRSGYWSPWSEQIYRPCPDCPELPQFILVGPEDAVRLTRELHDPEQRDVDYGWVAPIDDLSMNVDEARDVQVYASRVLGEVTDRHTRFGRLFACCGRGYVAGLGFFAHRRDTEFRSSMPLVLHEVDRRTATAAGPLRLLLIAGLGVAAAVVAAAAAFAVAGRRTEAAFLHARGWGPGRFAVKATVEAVIPIGLGAAAGLGAASWLIATFGPSGPVSPSARTVSITWAVAAGAAGLVVLGIVSGVSFIRTFETHSVRRRLAWVPWEILPIVGSLLVLSRLNAGGALIEDTRLDILRPSALLLVFPVLFVAGFATLGARILVEVLRRTGGRASGRSPVTYLAFHRLTGLPKLTVLLVGASALCLGIFIDSQTMVGSLRATVDAKAGVFVGSDVQVLIDSSAPEQEVFPLPITRATRVKYAGTMTPGDVPFDLLGIDPETIVGAAFWEDAFSDESLEDLVSRLPSQGGPLPAILVQGDGDPTGIAIGRAEAPIEVVGRATAFPGVSSDDPVLVVDARSLDRLLGTSANPFERPGARTEYWIAGPTDEALAAVGELDAFPLGTLTADEVKDVPFIAASIDTFSMLNVLGLAAAMLVIGVLVVYLQARQRARTVSNVLSMRMGMRDGQARAALVLELAAMLLTAYVLGATMGVVAGRLISPLLDPLQTIPPPPLFEPPIAAALWTLVGLAVVSVGGGWLVHRRASAIDLGEVLRVAE